MLGNNHNFNLLDDKMNEFKGTKGKWEFSEYNNGSSSLKSYDFIFGEIYNNDAMNNGEFEANARLISKAPELLEGIRILIERLEENGLGNFPSVIKYRQLYKEIIK